MSHLICSFLFFGSPGPPPSKNDNLAIHGESQGSQNVKLFASARKLLLKPQKDGPMDSFVSSWLSGRELFGFACKFCLDGYLFCNRDDSGNCESLK